MKGRPTFRLLVLYIPLIGILLATGVASAHNSGPARSEQLQIGGYRFTAAIYAWPPHVSQSVGITLRLTDPPAVPRSAYRVAVTAIPAPGLDEAPLNIPVHPDPDDYRRLALEPNLPAKGQWSLQFRVSGPRGQAQTTIPWYVEGPPAIPSWVGWLIGLIPLWGFLAFAYGEFRRFRKMIGAQTAGLPGRPRPEFTDSRQTGP